MTDRERPTMPDEIWAWYNTDGQLRCFSEQQASIDARYIRADSTPLDPDMPTAEIRLHMGELTPDEVRVARAAIRWANTRITT